MTEIVERSTDRGGAALTGIPHEAHKWASLSRPGGGAYCSRPGGGCSKTRGAVVAVEDQWKRHVSWPRATCDRRCARK